MIRYFRIEVVYHTEEHANIYVKGYFSNGYNNDDVVARAQDHGIDFDAVKSRLDPIEISVSDFNYATDDRASGINEYVAWEDGDGYYEPKRV